MLFSACTAIANRCFMLEAPSPFVVLEALNSFNVYVVYNNVRIFLPFVEFHDLFMIECTSEYIYICRTSHAVYCIVCTQQTSLKSD